MKPIPSALVGPMAMEPHWMRVMFGVWSRGRLEAGALAQARAEWELRRAAAATADEPTPVEGTGGTLRLVGEIGVINVRGPLFRHANLITDYSGGTTYDSIWRGIEAAEANRQVAKILFRFETPGGEANGVSELGRYIAGLTKPKWGYIDGLCASAGFWLGSQCDTLVAEETAEVGSIGVRVSIVDQSAMDQMDGVREIEIISSQSPGKRSHPIDDEVIARLQTRIDDLADIFVADVASGRRVKVSQVLEDFGQGDVMIAGKALRAGMIDGLGNFNSTLKALSLESSSGR
jgi:ClpP class serine protease